MHIAIRMDDITPGMDWEKFLRFKKLLDAYSIRPLIGVVPDCRDEKLMIDEPREDFWSYIKGLESKGWTIAMHGFNHCYTTKESGLFPIGSKSEFAGLSYEEQRRKIREGRRIMQEKGIDTEFFMAPSHSYDKNTLKALRESGFSRITDGFGKRPYSYRGMTFYPIAISKDFSLKDRQRGCVTLVYHTNTMNEEDFESFEKFLKSGRIVSYTEYLGMSAVNRTFIGGFAEYITAEMKRLLVNINKLRGQ